MDFSPFTEWALENPLLLVIAALAPGLLLLLGAELRDAARRRRERRLAPPEEPAAPAEEALPAPPVEREVSAPQAEAAAPAPTEPPPAPAPERVPAPQPAEPVAPPTPEPAEPTAPPAPAPIAPPPEPEAAPPPEPVAPPPPPPARLRDRLLRTRESFVGRLASVIRGRRLDAELLEELEMVLFSADLGVRTAEGLLEEVRREAAGGDADAVRRVLRKSVLEKLQRVEPAGDPLALQAKPHVVLVLGVNGSGKTTTIGKLAARHAEVGRRVVLGAGDTFRAAAIEQLQTWGERVGCEVIAGRPGGDPSAVAFDTVKAAVARKADVAIIDTAGRLQTKKPLMEELSKITRVIGRDLEGAPHETLLVLDANTGQNAISQARLFTEVAQVTGLVLTKLDGTAKGGVIVGLAEELGLPVRYVGVGESVSDLRDFSAQEFVDALFAE